MTTVEVQRPGKGLALAALLLLWSATAAAPSTLVVTGGTLIDGTGRTPIPDSTVVIANGKISAAGTLGTVAIPDGAERMDARGKWIVPGLIDMHVHYQDWMDPLFVSHGVTTVRDVGSNLDEILKQREGSATVGAKRGSGELVGVVNISEIVRGTFRSAYLGYYAFTPYEERGLMTEGVSLVVGDAFRWRGLHRLEANVQPGNDASIRLVRRLGFRREGYSPRYLKIRGRWRDHERWAALADEWPRTP